MVIFIPNIARGSKIVLNFTLNLFDNLSTSNLTVSWIYILVDLIEHIQFQGTGIYGKDTLNIFQLRDHLHQIWCKLIYCCCYCYYECFQTYLTQKNISLLLCLKLKTISIKLKGMEVNIQQIILLSVICSKRQFRLVLSTTHLYSRKKSI